MNTTTQLLIEIGVEELPTKAVTELAQAGATLWEQALADAQISCEKVSAFSTPRRLAWCLDTVALVQPDRDIFRKGPALTVAKDGEGNWTKAAFGFAASCGVAIEDLSIEEGGKERFLVFSGKEKGKTLKALFPELLLKVMQALPIAKRMRWGSGEWSFVRPVNTLVVLADDEVWPTSFLGVKSGNQTLGHRVHHPKPVVIQRAGTYVQDLWAARVVASHATRMDIIRRQLWHIGDVLDGTVIMPDELVEEVASLTEWPVAVVGKFEEKFLAIPQEVLITTMQDKQKMFAITATKNKKKALGEITPQGKLLPYFVTIVNLDSADVESVRKGNERVIRPRFKDAEFFWEQDCKRTLASFFPQLTQVVYQKKLGSLADKVRRIEAVAIDLAKAWGVDVSKVTQAARLSKSDLLTEMVMEYPELQGVMGRYYAEREGLDTEIVYALEEQYFPISAGAELPKHKTGIVLAIAEKLETLIGGFAIGAKPTGSKDPYALRRMAIGLIRIVVEKNLQLPLRQWLQRAAVAFPKELQAEKYVDEVCDYISERLQGCYREQDIPLTAYQAVRALNSDDLADMDRRIRALAKFLHCDGARSFLESAKRIRNILRKNGENWRGLQIAILIDPAEKALWQRWCCIKSEMDKAIKMGDYETALSASLQIADPLEVFFTEVMVMTEDAILRANRQALLTEIQAGLNTIADMAILG